MRAAHVLVFILVMISCASPLRPLENITDTPDELKSKVVELEPSVPTPPPISSDPTQSTPPPSPGPLPAPSQKDSEGKVGVSSEVSESKPKPEGASAKALKAIEKAKKGFDPKPLWTPKQWPFGIGEKIYLVLRYGLIEGGVGVLEVMEPKVLDGVPVLHIRGHVKSSRMLDLIYKVENSFDTYIRLDHMVPLKQEILQNESARWGRRVITFNPATQRSKFYSNMTNKKGEVKIEDVKGKVRAYAQDLFGALYFYRFIDDLRGANFPVHDRAKNWNAELKFVERTQVKIPAGVFWANHYKVHPRIQGKLETRGDVDIWIKDDPSKLLLKFNAKVKIGSVTGEIRSHVPGRPIPYPVPKMLTPFNLNQFGEVRKTESASK